MRNAVLAVALAGAAWGQSAGVADAFEVASIKPAAPPVTRGLFIQGCKGGPGSTAPGRITCTNVGLGFLIGMAYGIDFSRISGLQPASQNFDIIAELPAGATRDHVPQMWRKLLTERFKLWVHRETKPAPAYVLVVAKGGLKARESVSAEESDSDDRALPTERSKLDPEGFPIVLPGAGETSHRGNLAHFAASTWSMEELVKWLEPQLRMSGEGDRPVVDGTGLKGKYDFRMMWSPGNDRSADGPPFLNALESQLGLKLEQKQTQIETLVVDHADKLPSEN